MKKIERCPSESPKIDSDFLPTSQREKQLFVPFVVTRSKQATQKFKKCHVQAGETKLKKKKLEVGKF